MSSKLRLSIRVVRVFVLFAVVTLGLATVALAQPGYRPIYPFTGAPGSSTANYKWLDNPEQTTVWVFRKSVPRGESGGKVLRSPGQLSTWPDSSSLVNKTGLKLDPHPVYSGNALRTTDRYPVRQNGLDQRYLLLIETTDGLYSSRRLDGNTPNDPRYYTLDDPAHVRVGESPPGWAQQARAAIKGAKQEPDQSELDSSDTTAETSSGNQSSNDATNTSSSTSAESSSRWYFSALNWWMVGVGLLTVSGAFLLFLFLSKSGKKRKRKSRKKRSGKSRGRSSSSQSGSSVDKSLSARQKQKIREGMVDPLEDRIDDIESRVAKFVQENADATEARNDRIDQLEHRIEEIEEVIGQMRQYLEAQAGSNQEGDQPCSSNRKERATTSKKVADSFVDWCHTAGGRVRKLERFQDHLSDHIQSAGARAVEYERDSIHDEFIDDARNGINYWLVEAEGEKYVFPHPVNRARFGNLQPVYEGDAAPKSLEGIEPARLTREAGRLVLDEPGHVW